MAFALLSRSRSKTQGSVKPVPNQKSARAQHSADSRSGFAKPVFQPQTAALPAAPVIQTKLKVGEPTDKFEEEADRVAELTGNDNGSISPSAVARNPSPAGNLQRLYGNQAVLQMRNGSGGLSAASVPLRPSQGGILQRKCACGGAAGMPGECAECSKKQRLGLQTKLKINEPGDIYEQEADRIADQVLSTPAHPVVSGAPPRIQRFSGQPNGQMDAAPASVDQALASPGRPLELALRQDMEQRFGYDFSRVRVHSGGAAEQSVREVNANAYTVGHNIVFGAGGFAPGTQEGRRLIAHELTHVVQQSGSDGIRVYSSNEKRGLFPIPSINERTLQRAVCLGGEWRHANTDETAIQAYDKIERAYNAFLAIVDDPRVDMNAKLNMGNAIKLSIVAWKAYVKEIEGTCSSSSSTASPMLAQAGTMNPLHVAVATFAFLLFAESARRLSMSEQRSVNDLGKALALLAILLAAVTRKVEIPEPEPEPVGADPIPFIPLPEPKPEPKAEPKPEPKPTPQVPEEQRRRRCPPVILLLPRAKAQDLDAYSALIGQLEHVPNRPRDTNQRTSWAALTPGRIPPAVWFRAATLGLFHDQVVFPFWSQSAVYDNTMQVDHDIEMQVTPIGREAAFDTPVHHRLMDASSNLGAGPELEHNILKMREALVACTRDQGWMYRRLLFERVAASTSNNPGIWTRDDLIAGRHLDAYERLGRPWPPPP